MNQFNIPLLLEADVLEQLLNVDDILIVDLSSADIYEDYHIEGAVHLDVEQISASSPPVMGLLPDLETINHVLSDIGLTPNKHVIAYDDDMGLKACRFLWTLDAIGHHNFSLLNGGLHAWMGEGFPTSDEAVTPTPSHYQTNAFNSDAIASKAEILAGLETNNNILLDVRSDSEFSGWDKRAMRGGHIPGAKNVEWIAAVDRERNTRFKPENELQALYEEAGIDKDKTVITYCQTHRRSAHTYIVLKSLGYKNIKGYPGSWSEWGNSEETPIE
ncbi:MAG TPA: sulfurtransferase [Gammaproteobacteria bacterium]|nr:sulfurtransferase [Gammaproteobacteria bacterium]